MDRIQYLKTALKSDEIEMSFPQYFQIETTAGCNAKCVMCSHDQWERKTKNMSDALFNRVAEEICLHKDTVNTVTIQLGGEPLLDKKLEQRIRTLKDRGIKRVVFATNASLLDKKRSKSLLESGIDEVYFSIDSVVKKTYEDIRLGLSYETVIENIINFINIRNELSAKTAAVIRAVMLEENKHEEQSFISFWKKHLTDNDRVYVKPAHNFANSVNIALSEQSNYDSYPCHALWNSAIILSDGRMTACCMDLNGKYELGDINNSSIEAIWQTSATLKNLRQEHLKGGRGSVDFCKGCNVWF